MQVFVFTSKLRATTFAFSASRSDFALPRDLAPWEFQSEIPNLQPGDTGRIGISPADATEIVEAVAKHGFFVSAPRETLGAPSRSMKQRAERPMSDLTQDEVDLRVKDAINATFPFGKPDFDRKVLVSLSVEINRAFDRNLTPKLVPMIRNSLRKAGYAEWTGGFNASLRT